jgi:hypothetical protein
MPQPKRSSGVGQRPGMSPELERWRYLISRRAQPILLVWQMRHQN